MSLPPIFQLMVGKRLVVSRVSLQRYVQMAHTPNKHDRNKFSKKEVERVWTMKDDPYYQIVLMLLYNGCRISEFLDLKKENVHLEE